jgi:hypothetical protein
MNERVQNLERTVTIRPYDLDNKLHPGSPLVDAATASNVHL